MATAARFRWKSLGAVAVAMRSTMRPDAPSLAARLGALPRMAAAIMRKEYGGTDLRSLAMMLAAAGYVVSPVDLLPEGLLLIPGLADDAIVVTWLAVAVVRATDDFLEWELNRAAVPGEVI